MLPVTAMPAAVPIRWPVCRTPPALPARATGTWDRVRVRLGEITSPPPRPAISSGNAVHGATSWPGWAPTASQTPVIPTRKVASPKATSLGPRRRTWRLPAEATSTPPTANGVAARPDFHAAPAQAPGPDTGVWVSSARVAHAAHEHLGRHAVEA